MRNSGKKLSTSNSHNDLLNIAVISIYLHKCLTLNLFGFLMLLCVDVIFVIFKSFGNLSNLESLDGFVFNWTWFGRRR